MTKLEEKLALVINCGFVPILVRDAFDPALLCEFAREAGLPAVEFTLRRKDLEKIAVIRKTFPDLILLAGSTVDQPVMVKFLKTSRLFFSLEELGDLGVDGFVSMVPFRKVTYRKFARTKVLIPGVASAGEAIEHLALGAHLAKFVNGTDGYLKGMQAPTHGIIPIFYTGGATLERIPGLINSCVLVCGAGFDVILGSRYEEMQKKPDRKYILERLRLYREAVSAARRETGEEDYQRLTGKKLLKATGRYFSCLG